MRGYGKADRLKLTALLGAAALCALLVTGGARSSAEGRRAADNSPAESVNGASGGARPFHAQGGAAAAQSTPQTAAQPQPEGCVSCHTQIEPMHETSTGKLDKGDRDGQNLSCTYCHGGNPAVRPASNSAADQERAKRDSHVRPRFPDEWERDGKLSSANPERALTLLNRESWEFVRFVNPADLRSSQKTCGECHQAEVTANESSMMRHGAMLWGAALYNNGGFPIKDSRFGEVYAEETGAPARIIQIPQPTKEEQLAKGWLPFLDPLPR